MPGAPYSTPYLTCSECNTLNIVNPIFLLKKVNLVPADGRSFPPESLPVCIGCSRALKLVAGVKNLSHHITEEQEHQVQYFNTKRRCAVQIQRVFRGRQGRKRTQLIKETNAKQEALQIYAAVKIQALIKGKINRRIVMIQSALDIIKDATAIVRSLITTNMHFRKRKRVFWYRPDEAEFLMREYRTFVSRSGNDPPLHIVENNIIEVARRILEYQSYMATIIQSKWRQVPMKRFVAEVKYLTCLQREKRHNAVITIQRNVRTRLVKKKLQSRINEKKVNHLNNMFVGRQQYRKAVAERAKIEHELLVSYRKTKMESYAAACVGKISFSSTDSGQKASLMSVYQQSEYGTNRLDGSISKFVKAKRDHFQRMELKQQRKVDRERNIKEKMRLRVSTNN